MNTERTPLLRIGQYCENELYIKRDDLYPYCFGGNKARKAELFFQEIDNSDYDCVVTYGSSSSNHCRVISNMAAARNMPCYIISPTETSEETYNKKLMLQFGAEIETVAVNDVHDTIENKLELLKRNGKKPYFIPGGGHGNIGTQAYVDCYEEILEYEEENNIHFDYIFHASGTGTTQAGLVCGQLMHNDLRTIVGISIARRNPRGSEIILNSISEYCKENDISVSKEEIRHRTVFIDDYTGDGYGKNSEKVLKKIKNIMISYGIPLDSTYTGKAFWGMEHYLAKHDISGKTILFIHTGGTPLYFDLLKDDDSD